MDTILYALPALAFFCVIAWLVWLLSRCVRLVLDLRAERANLRESLETALTELDSYRTANHHMAQCLLGRAHVARIEAMQEARLVN